MKHQQLPFLSTFYDDNDDDDHLDFCPSLWQSVIQQNLVFLIFCVLALGFMRDVVRFGVFSDEFNSRRMQSRDCPPAMVVFVLFSVTFHDISPYISSCCCCSDCPFAWYQEPKRCPG